SAKPTNITTIVAAPASTARLAPVALSECGAGASPERHREGVAAGIVDDAVAGDERHLQHRARIVLPLDRHADDEPVRPPDLRTDNGEVCALPRGGIAGIQQFVHCARPACGRPIKPDGRSGPFRKDTEPSKAEAGPAVFDLAQIQSGQKVLAWLRLGL